jgi:signal transduction histidine kinase
MLVDAASSARNAAGTPQNAHHHVVQFYENDEFLFDAVARFIAGGLKVGQPAIVYARPESRSAFITRLDRFGFDYHTASRTGTLTMHDARETLATFMRGSMIDEDRFMTEVGSQIQQTTNGRQVTVRAFGEMVDVLFRDGNAGAAIRLEELWNRLAEQHSFELLCAYAINNFYTETHAQQLKDICRTHSHVVPAETYSLLADDESRALKVIELQQSQRALHVEIEHRKAIERALREALAERQSAKEEAERAIAARSEFLAVISHELRTPLTAIIGYEELLHQGLGGPLTEQQQTFLAGIRAGASHLLRLIEQILTQSRVTAGKEAVQTAPTDLGQLVSSCAALMQPLAAENGLALTVKVVPDIVANTDAGKVQQIVLNLLSNAIKFTRVGSVDVRFATDGETAFVDVCDTGIGIAHDHLERIFEPFVQIDSTTTRAHNGAGLGLSVSRDLARLLGGDVVARSTVGVGSAFTLTLPIN